MSATVGTGVSSARRGEVTLWGAAIVLSGFLFPGLGIVVGVVLATTRLKHNSVAVRAGLIALGVVVLTVQIVGMAAWSDVFGGAGPAVRVG
ncbi:hypothetical protein ACIOC2_37045 [Streptomyces sp. NPDC088337]|uniref:hypothetical protein n=1 Tax=unclassified Streptomyces TaxID=2593676 RepID=UPI003828CF8F